MLHAVSFQAQVHHGGTPPEGGFGVEQGAIFPTDALASLLKGSPTLSTAPSN